MTHQVQYNIPKFEAVEKNMHLFLERCRRSNNVMVAYFDAVRLYTGAQPGGGAFGAFAPPKFSKYCIAILTFAETFK